MKKNDQKTNKPNGFFSVGFAILFMILGFYLFTQVAHNQNAINPLLVKGLGIACILFFGAIIIINIARSLKKKK